MGSRSSRAGNPPPQQQPPPKFQDYAAAIGAGELLPPEAVVGAVPVAGVLTTAAAAAAVLGVLSAFGDFNKKRERAFRPYLTDTLTRMYPDRTTEEILRYVRDELARDREFVRNQQERLQKDLVEAMKLPSEQRAARIQAILDRERRYTQMREQAALERAAARVSFLNVKDDSPDGAYWMLGAAKTHTPSCIGMAGKFWPWAVLDKLHPQLHPGCRCHLLGKDEAIQRGFMHPDQANVDPKDALKRAAEIAKLEDIVMEAASPEEIREYLDVIQEAPYRLRKGTHGGGEFARRGELGVPILARHFIERLLRKVAPHPSTPAERRRDGAGEWRKVAGREVFIPEHRGWEREFNGKRFYSPPQSTSVYEREHFIAKPPGEVPIEQHERVTQTAQDLAAQWRTRAYERGLSALAKQDKNVLPAEVGSQPKATHQGLRDAGFHPTDQHIPSQTDSVTRWYEHPSSGARAVVTYHHGRVTHVGWTPGEAPQAVKPLLDRPPRSEQEFLDDVFSLAHSLADDYGRKPQMRRASINDDMYDMSGQHSWQGVTELGVDSHKAIKALQDAAREKRPLTFSESRSVYALYRAAAHESLHAAAPISEREYAENAPSRALEEGLTEELAAVEAVKMLRRQGLTDVLRWLRANPADYKVEGNYSQYRHALSRILDRAMLPPEKRQDVIEHLKFSFRPNQRVDGLASLVTHAGTALHGPNHDEARDWVEQMLDHADTRTWASGVPGSGDVVFTPNIRPDLADVPEVPPVEVQGQPIHPGTRVSVRGRTGIVQAVFHRDEGPLFDVEYGSAGMRTGFDHGVHPDEIQDVLRQPEGVEPMVGALRIKDETFRPGDRLSYLNDMGGRTGATVERIVRASNPDMIRPHRGWQMEARTDEGVPVLLDHGRARDLQLEGSLQSDATLGAVGDVRRTPGGERRGEWLDSLTAGPITPRTQFPYWNGWKDLKPGDRVVSYKSGSGVKARGEVVSVRSKRTGHHAGSVGVTVKWDNGHTGRVSDPAHVLRREEGPFEPPSPERMTPGGQADAFREYGPIPEKLTWKAVGLGVYETPDGRLTMYRLEGVHPPAWNVEWTTGYAWDVSGHKGEEGGSGWTDPLYTNIVDGAATMKDAKAFAADEWETLRQVVQGWEVGKLGAVTPGGERQREPEIPASWPERGLDWQRRWNALPDDAEVWLFHATRPDTAAAMLSDGIDPAGKPMTLGRQRFESGEYAEFQPGAGLAPGLTVGYEPWSISGYGHEMLAVRVRKGDVQMSPEQAGLGATLPSEALRVNDAQVTVPIPASSIRRLDLGGRVPTRAVLDQLGTSRMAPGGERGLRVEGPFKWVPGREMIVVRDPNADDPDWDRAVAKGLAQPPQQRGAVAQMDFAVADKRYGRGNGRGQVEIGLMLTDDEHRRQGHASTLIQRLVETYPPEKYDYTASSTSPSGEGFLRSAVGRGLLPPGDFTPTKEVYRGHTVVRYDSHSAVPKDAKPVELPETSVSPATTIHVTKDGSVFRDGRHIGSVGKGSYGWQQAAAGHAGRVLRASGTSDEWRAFHPDDTNGYRGGHFRDKSKNTKRAAMQYLVARDEGFGEGDASYHSKSAYRPRLTPGGERDEDYRGHHTAPAREEGMSLDDPTNAFGGDEIYGPNALHYYGTGGPAPQQDPETQAWARRSQQASRESLAAITAARGNPDHKVTVYRAVPKDAPDEIAPRDWVTPSKTYAEIHGESNIEAPGGGYDEPSDYKVVSAQVRAGDLFTDGDLSEWGWQPSQAKGDVRGGLQSWIASPQSMRIHMHAVLHPEGATPYEQMAGSGKEMRDEAQAILDEIRTNGKPNDVTLYRGGGGPPGEIPSSWTPSKKVAREFAGKGGTIETLRPGEGFGIKVADYVAEGRPEEKQWLLVARPRLTPGGERPTDTYLMPYHVEVSGWTPENDPVTWSGYGMTKPEAIADAQKKANITEVGDVDVLKEPPPEPEVDAPYPENRSEWDRWGVDLVPVETLMPMRDAQDTTTPEKITGLRQAISSEGMIEPIVIDHALTDGRTYVSEGNNRLEAAAAEGFTHVPARVITVAKVHERHGGVMLPPADPSSVGQYALPSDLGLPGVPGGRRQRLTPGGERLSDEDRVSVAEQVMERAGLHGGVMVNPVGHAHHPTEEGRAAAERLTKEAQEISGDPTLRAQISDWITGPGGDVGQAVYKQTHHAVTVRPESNRMTFLHEIAHAMTHTEHGVGGHGPEFRETAATLYGKHISPEAEQTFRKLATPPTAATAKVKISSGLATEIDMIESLDSVHSEDDIRDYVSGWGAGSGAEDFIREWVRARAAKKKSGALDLNLTPLAREFLWRSLDNSIDIWTDNAEIGFASQKNRAFIRAARALMGKLRLNEGEFEEFLHPRGRAGRWVFKGVVKEAVDAARARRELPGQGKMHTRTTTPVEGQEGLLDAIKIQAREAGIRGHRKYETWTRGKLRAMTAKENGAKVAVRVRAETLPTLLDEGRLRNWHHGSAVEIPAKQRSETYGPGRAGLERAWFGIDPAETEHPDAYPIYGYISTDREDLGKDETGQWRAAGHAFGDVKLTLKDTVRPRTTINYSDSMYATGGGHEPTNLVPSPVDTPSELSVSHFQNLGGVEKPVIEVGDIVQPLPEFTPEEEARIEAAGRAFGRMASEEDRAGMREGKRREIAREEKGWRPYQHGDFIEAQIHGGVHIPEDIERIDFTSPADAKVKEKLDALGIPYTEPSEWPEEANVLVGAMRQFLTLRANNLSDEAKAKLRYLGWEDFVLKHGRLFHHDPEGSRLETNFHATTARECFTNALMAAVGNPDLTYVEGFAFNGLLPIHHAWVVDKEGRVYDPTWENIQGRQGGDDIYLGVPFETDYVTKTVMAKGTDTMMDESGRGVELEKEPKPGEIATGVGGIAVPEHLQGVDTELLAQIERGMKKAQEMKGKLSESVFDPAKHPRSRLGRWVPTFIISPIGMPGSGKGTIGKALAEHYGVPHISAGDMLRAVPRDSELGRQIHPLIEQGKLVDDHLIARMVTDRLAQPDVRNGVVLDGVPRTELQRQLLEQAGIKPTYVELALDKDAAVHRLLRRAEIEGRADDNPKVIEQRFKVFADETEPMLRSLRASGEVVTVPQGDGIEENVARTKKALAQAEVEPGELIRGATRSRGKGRAGLKAKATGWVKKVEEVQGEPVLKARELVARRTVASEMRTDEDPVKREVAQAVLDDYWGVPGVADYRPGRYQTISGDPGFAFEEQHQRIMEAGAAIDAEVTRRMKPKQQVYAAAEKAARDARRAKMLAAAEHERIRAEVMVEKLKTAGWYDDEYLAQMDVPTAPAVAAAFGERPPFDPVEDVQRRMRSYQREKRKELEALSQDRKSRANELVLSANREVALAHYAADKDERVMAAKDARHDAGIDVFEAELAERRARAALNVARRNAAYETLREVRVFAQPGTLRVESAQPGSEQAAEAVLRLLDAARWLPRDWIESSNSERDESGRRLIATLGVRGRYIHQTTVQAAGGDPDAEGEKADMILGSDSRFDRPDAEGIAQGVGVMVHELVHRSERVRDGITGAEWTFYTSRVSPSKNARWEDAAPLRELTGVDSYRPEEKARPDDFVDAYSGKTYGDQPDSPYEILSMGIEDLVTGAHEILANDPEYRQFVFGSLATL